MYYIGSICCHCVLNRNYNLWATGENRHGEFGCGRSPNLQSSPRKTQGCGTELWSGKESFNPHHNPEINT